MQRCGQGVVIQCHAMQKICYSRFFQTDFENDYTIKSYEILERKRQKKVATFSGIEDYFVRNSFSKMIANR